MPDSHIYQVFPNLYDGIIAMSPVYEVCMCMHMFVCAGQGPGGTLGVHTFTCET